MELRRYRPEDVLTWFVQREQWQLLLKRGEPDYLMFQEKDLLFLL